MGQITTDRSDEADLTQAKLAAHDARWSDADRMVRRYLASHQASAEGRYLLALALFHENRPKESLTEYTHASNLKTPTATDLRDVAYDYVLLNDYADADKWMTKSVSWNGTDAETWYALGRIKYTENRFAEAVSSFQRSLELQPKLVKAENNLGLAYEGLNRPRDAIAAYRQAIAWQQNETHPSEQPYLNLGTLLLDRNQTDEARVLLTRAASLAPQDSKIHAALGRLYRHTGDLAHAQSEFEQAVAADPKNAALRFQLGQVYRNEGQQAKAKAELARAAELDGTHSSSDK
ncbi:MAG: tetratricopeptide repeat protein [Acidobacteriaceae bacterium]